MGGAESKDVRAEEKSEAAPAKRRVLTKLELMEERLAFFEWKLRYHHIISRKHLLWRHHNLSSSSTFPFTMSGAGSQDEWSEEEREAAAAKEREIMKKKLKEVCLALRREDLLRRHQNLSSFSTFPFTMSGAEEDEWSEEEREAAAAKEREIREKELKEVRLALRREDLLRRHQNLSSSSTFPFTMGGAESQDEWAEEELHLCRTEEKKLKEVCLALKRWNLRSHEHVPNFVCSSTFPFTMIRAGSQDVRAEEKSEDPPAKRREIMESMEERLVFIEWNLWSHEPDPNISPSFLTFPFTMSGAEEDEWAEEEKREAAAAKRREIRELESMEERLAFMWHHLWHHFRDHHHFFFREHLRPHEPGPFFFRAKEELHLCRAEEELHLCRTEEEREAAAKECEIRTLKLKEEYMAFKRHRLSSLEPDPNLSRAEEELHLCRAEEKREAAKEREIREKKLMEEYMAFRRQYVSSLEPDPNISSERSFGSSAEEERAGSPASSCVSLKRWDSKGLLIEF